MPALLNRTFFPNNVGTKFVSVFLNEYFTPHVKIGTSTHQVVLNPTEWFTLVSFKNKTFKNSYYRLGDIHLFLDTHYNRSIRIICYNSYVLLSKGQWRTLLHLSNSNINAQILKLFDVHHELVQWRDNCIRSNAFCAPPLINEIDFQLLYNTFMPRIFIPVPTMTWMC
jgi:hypothetical protein